MEEQLFQLNLQIVVFYLNSVQNWTKLDQDFGSVESDQLPLSEDEKMRNSHDLGWVDLDMILSHAQF